MVNPRTDIGYGIRRKMPAFFLRKWFNRTLKYAFTIFIGKILAFFVSVLIPMSVLGVKSIVERN